MVIPQRKRLPHDRARERRAPKLGEIIAIKDGDRWELAVVRRMQRHSREVICASRSSPTGWCACFCAAGSLRLTPRAPASTGVFRHLSGRSRGRIVRRATESYRPDDRFLPGGWSSSHRARALSDPVHPDAGAAGGLGLGAVNAVRKLSP